jgi:site-specific DNA-cytosine methylase
MQSTRYVCQILKKLEFSQQTFEKYSNIKFHENPTSRSRIVLCGRTGTQADIYDEANNRISQFCERA